MLIDKLNYVIKDNYINQKYNYVNQKHNYIKRQTHLY